MSSDGPNLFQETYFELNLDDIQICMRYWSTLELSFIKDFELTLHLIWLLWEFDTDLLLLVSIAHSLSSLALAIRQPVNHPQNHGARPVATYKWNGKMEEWTVCILFNNYVKY